MTARGREHVKIADFKGSKRDEGAIDIEAEDGTVFTIDPPALWPDDIIRLQKEQDAIGMAVALLGGQERYDAFLAAGGTASMIGSLIAEKHGVKPGESAASSSS